MLSNHSRHQPLADLSTLRPVATVMDIARLGAMHQTRLSFMRVMMRTIMREQWRIATQLSDLDDHGYGTLVYTIDTPQNRYSFVVFSNYLADEDRNDRVIADQWDVTLALCMGAVSPAQLSEMRDNVPKQEAGRASANMLVLSRGNKSMRNFDYVVEQLANGQQPDPTVLSKVGYLYRTTAVYGSGKFGLADWQKVKQHCPEFAKPFAAEMFACFMLRHFSIEQAEHLARIRAPQKAVALAPQIKRFIGIGNSTGLGMAPYLIRHPQLISRWIATRESAIADVVQNGDFNNASIQRFISVMDKILTHFAQTQVPDQDQTARNELLKKELSALLQKDLAALSSWLDVLKFAQSLSLESQELINSALLETHPQISDQYQYPCVQEQLTGQPQMRLSELKRLFEQHYDWALAIDFSQADANYFFWYRSQEKMEPRLGVQNQEPGADQAMPLVIAKQLHACYQQLCADLLCADLKSNHEPELVAHFLLRHPQFSSTVRRAQAMANECYGEVRANLADKTMRPMDLLRCKLSFFGVSKFDPKSKLWVRNTMFQGAPVVADIGGEFDDDWYFPVAPSVLN